MGNRNHHAPYVWPSLARRQSEQRLQRATEQDLAAYRRECVGKRPCTRSLARESAARLRADTGHDITSYRCKWCRAYHFGHTPHRVN